ncbi:MAG TPA: TPM domain-containing protein [Cyclobacteriaceae bacterium]|jgi:putative membrane protein|nr:TPM domain-containing protein [Cyclobacteriaceae bacterium]
MSIKSRFGTAELERIKSAVHTAEDKISGEIVPVFVEKSGYYSIANYRAAIVSGALGFLWIMYSDRYLPSMAIYDPQLIFLMVVILGVVGALACHFIPFIKKFFVGQQHLDRSTKQRAETLFLQEEVFNTRHRTGIMIFISFFEREVIVMADRGISKVVEQKEWDKIVQGIIQNIKKGKVIDGIESAVLRCGDILLEKGFVKTADDVNELRDDLRIE